jgi:hypothetical protein
MSNPRRLSLDTNPEEYENTDDTLFRFMAWFALIGGSVATAGYCVFEYYIPTIMEQLRECGESPRFGSAQLALVYLRLVMLGTGTYLLRRAYQSRAGLNCSRNTIFYHSVTNSDIDDNDAIELHTPSPSN